MPGGNRMGPMGQGPKTGRGMGRCGGANAQGNVRQGGPGLGLGRGRGRGRQSGPGGGKRSGMPAGGQPREDEKRDLQRQAEMLREQLARIEDRLKDVGDSQPDKVR